MTEASFFSDLSQESVEQANVLLAWMSDNVQNPWATTLNQVLPETEAQGLLAKLPADFDPVGVIVGGTGIAKEHAGLSGEESQRAVRLLKRTGKLIQAGKGRGKALIVVNVTPLAMTDFQLPVRPPTVVRDNLGESVPMLLKRARDGYMAISEELDALRAKVAQMNNLVVENIDLRNEVTKLQAELDRSLAHTWG